MQVLIIIMIDLLCIVGTGHGHQPGAFARPFPSGVAGAGVSTRGSGVASGVGSGVAVDGVSGRCFGVPGVDGGAVGGVDGGAEGLRGAQGRPQRGQPRRLRPRSRGGSFSRSGTLK